MEDGGWEGDNSIHVATNFSEVGTGMEPHGDRRVEMEPYGDGEEEMESYGVGGMEMKLDGDGGTDGWTARREEEGLMGGRRGQVVLTSSSSL